MVSVVKKLALLKKPSEQLVPIISIEVGELGLSNAELDRACSEGREVLRQRFPFNQEFLAVIAPKMRKGKPVGPPKVLICHGYSMSEDRARRKLTTVRDRAACSCPLVDLPRLSLAPNPLPSKKDILRDP